LLEKSDLEIAEKERIWETIHSEKKQNKLLQEDIEKIKDELKN